MASGVLRVMSMRSPREGESREAQDRDQSGMARFVLGHPHWPVSLARLSRQAQLISTGKLNFWLFGIGPEEHNGMADDAAKSRCRSLRQVFGCLFLVLWLPQANLDQFMAREGFVEGFEHCRTDAPFPDEDDRPEGMGQTPKVFALFSVKGRRGAGYHRRREGLFGRRGRG
jgi:hypothetical protein